MTSRSKSQYTLGLAGQREGIERVYNNNEDWVNMARLEAIRICHAQGYVSSVDLRYWADRTGQHPRHPNAWGSIFRGKVWAHTGEWVPCEHADGHARHVRVWEYVGSDFADAEMQKTPAGVFQRKDSK